MCFRRSCYKEEIDIYCKFENLFHFIFVDSVKRRICDVKHSRVEHDLPILVNGRMILLFREVSFSRNFANKETLAKNSEFTVYI